MELSNKSVSLLKTAIQDGTFPDTDEVLTSTLTANNIPSLLAAITEAKDSISNDIRRTSNEQASDVDQWILQAKKAQDDIAKCKIEARNIVEEHQRVEVLRRDVQEKSRKVELLQNEIAFSRALEHEVELVGELAQVLGEIEQDLHQSSPTAGVGRLLSVHASLPGISASQTRSLLGDMERDLRSQTRLQLQQAIEAKFSTGVSDQQLWISFPPKSDAPQTSADESIQQLTEALEQLGHLSDTISVVTRILEKSLIPLFSAKSGPFPVMLEAENDRMLFELAASKPDASTVLNTFHFFVDNLHSRLATILQDQVARSLLTKLVPTLIINWLDTAVPYELDNLKEMEVLQGQVATIASLLHQFSWPGHEELNDWIDQIPRTWLTKRRTRSLDAVRLAFHSSSRSLREVERVERQKVVSEEPATDNDWDAAWDDEPAPREDKAAAAAAAATAEDEDDTSGWDFDTEDIDSASESKTQPTTEGEEEEDAWGWGDELAADNDIEHPKKTLSVNGQAQPTQQGKEVILTETYNITDIPDHILEVIEKDVSDSQTLISSTPEAYFKSTAPTSALQALPNLTLAMFRATAPTYYSLSSKLSNMNLYNDTVYINQKLEENPDKSLQKALQSTIEAMSKFARQTYTRELETQRTILSDLLEGAQGFVSCTRFPYDQECTNAITAVIDRIHTVHKEWVAILSRSHLFQSIGTLIAMIMGKIIHDILDMEDISEPESQRLVQHCQKIASLESLFVVSPSASQPHTQGHGEEQSEEQPMSTITLYVHNYLRFMYLINILESSLADIKYMWTEGELRLEFQADEVVDLIRALFAESGLRRAAIGEIRGR